MMSSFYPIFKQSAGSWEGNADQEKQQQQWGEEKNSE